MTYDPADKAPAEEEEELGRHEYPYRCPFCVENFDIIGLYCHIDYDHVIEAKDGVCPVCEKMVGLDLVEHVIKKHNKHQKVSEKGESSASLRKEERNENSHLFYQGSSSNNLQLDPLLSSFNYFPAPVVQETCVVQHLSSDDKSSNEDQSKDNTTDRRSSMFASSSSNKDEGEEEEKAGKSEFVQRLILSTLLKD